MEHLTDRAEPEASWSPEVYDELRRIAGSLMADERAAHTLRPTALVHEAWLRLRRSRNAASMSLGEFRGLAAQTMRRVLTDHARRRTSARRGGGVRRTTLEGKAAAPQAALDLDGALTDLEAHDPELARLVELRFYGGCSTLQVAEALSLSERTVKRRWRFARAWLHQYILELDS